MEPNHHTLKVSHAEEEALIRRLCSARLGERVQAMQELQRRGPEATELLLRFLTQETLRREKKKRLFKVLLGGGLASAGLLGLALILTENYHLLGVLGSFGGLGGLAGLLAPSAPQIAAANALAQQDDPRAVGPLIEALSFQENSVRTAAATALMRLLPRVQPDDAALLTPAQLATLHRLLLNGDRNTETDFLITILEMLARIEDVSALPTVDQLLWKSFYPQTENALRFREAAEQTQAVLRACRERLEENRTLLRASGEPTSARDTLLRPARSTPQGDPQQLLHIHVPDE